MDFVPSKILMKTHGERVAFAFSGTLSRFLHAAEQWLSWNLEPLLSEGFLKFALGFGL
jgi:hypothetical protein